MFLEGIGPSDSFWENLKMTKLIKSLEEIMKVDGQSSVFTDLKENDRMMKDAGVFYSLDLNKIFGSQKFNSIREARDLGDLYNAVRKIFDKPYKTLQNRENNFSEAFESGNGECMEKSVLFQIAMDLFKKSENTPLSDKKCFYVAGFIKSESEPFKGHAFNIITSGKKGILIDSENPISYLGSESPYVVPAVGIDFKKSGKIIIPREFSHGRTYTF